MTPKLPLERYELLRTNRIGELEERCGEFDLTFRLRQRPVRDFAASLRMVRAGDLDFGVWSQDEECEVVEPARGDRFHFLFPLRGRALYRNGGSEVAAAVGRAAACLHPDRPSEVRHGRGWADFGIAVRRSAILRASRTLSGGDACVDFDTRIDLTSRPGQRIERHARYLLRECDAADGLLHDPAAGAALTESFLVTLLTQLGRGADAALADPGLRRVREARAYIDARLEQPMRMGRVAEQVGIGLRSLQAAFRRHTGETPQQFLLRRRLERARDWLRSDPDVSITSVALGCGMPHFGRFSTQYRRHFGESPSETRGFCRNG